MQGRLAVVIEPSPEMAHYVYEYGLGLVAEDFEAADLTKQFLTLDKNRIKDFNLAADNAAAELNWEKFASSFTNTVEKLLAKGSIQER